MQNYVLAGYLALVGLVTLVDTKIPVWVVGVAALATAGALLFSKSQSK